MQDLYGGPAQVTSDIANKGRPIVGRNGADDSSETLGLCKYT